jgi:hypothetical protein
MEQFLRRHGLRPRGARSTNLQWSLTVARFLIRSRVNSFFAQMSIKTIDPGACRGYDFDQMSINGGNHAPAP